VYLGLISLSICVIDEPDRPLAALISHILVFALAQKHSTNFLSSACGMEYGTLIVINTLSVIFLFTQSNTSACVNGVSPRERLGGQ